jgi:hypothetical protein
MYNTSGSQKTCLLIYIHGPLKAIQNVYIHHKYISPQARATSWYKTRLTSLIKINIQNTIKGPLRHPQLPLPQEEVVAHPYLPQAVVVEHLLDRPAQVAGVHSS